MIRYFSKTVEDRHVVTLPMTLSNPDRSKSPLFTFWVFLHIFQTAKATVFKFSSLFR